MPRRVGHEDTDPHFIDLNEFVEIPRDGGHGPIRGAHPQMPDQGHAGWKNRQLDLPGDFQLVLDGEQAALVREGELQRHIPEGGQQSRETEMVQDPWNADVHRAHQVDEERLAGEHERTDGHHAAILQSQVPGGQAGHRDDDQQDQEYGGREQVVIELPPVGWLHEDEGEDAAGGDRDSEHGSRLDEPTKPAQAQLEKGERTGDDEQIGDDDVRVRGGDLKPARRGRHHGGRPIQSRDAVHRAPDSNQTNMRTLRPRRNAAIAQVANPTNRNIDPTTMSAI